LVPGFHLETHSASAAGLPLIVALLDTLFSVKCFLWRS
jgi:hypothetical protein